MAEVDVKILITRKAYLRMKYFTEITTEEIGGLLVVDTNCNTLTVEDVILTKQEASAGGVNFDESDFSRILNNMARYKPDLIPKIKGWWHSHSDMNTFWSSTDEDAIRKYKKLCGICVSINTNRSGNFLVRLDVDKPINFKIDDIPFQILMEEANIKRRCEREFREKVSKPAPQVQVQPKKGFFNGWFRNKPDNYDYVY